MRRPTPGALAEWYQQHLGFPKKAVFEGGDYAIVRRGDLTLHFWKCRDRHIAENTACYTEVRSLEALDALHAEFISNAQNDGFAPGRVEDVPKTQTGHDMREFHVWDPSGNLIGFGAQI
ncbi:VOC family protein [Hellea balneolensis]|uniref:hypothetical protein n=1 Tax=Hellea balneolensis TaxID=287478 RepID=UPI000408C349|nr:hypothetical protein [Hellea balneolensis]